MSLHRPTSLLIASLFSFSCTALAANLEQAISLFEAGQTEQAVQMFSAHDDNPQAMLYLAQAYMQSDLDEAEELIDKAIAAKSKDALYWYWRGRIMGAQAQSSVFSALSFAGKSLDSFTKAVELEPNVIRYRNALMQFHLQAPSIAGGDLDIAKQQIAKIQQLDPQAGLRAQIDFELAQDNLESAAHLLSQGKQDYSESSLFFFESGMFYQQQKQYQQAFEDLQVAASKTATSKEQIETKYIALYQVGKTAGLSETNLALGIQALNQYIQAAPVNRTLPPKEWAEFRLANLLALSKQTHQAKDIYLKLAKSDSEELAKQAKKAARKI